MRHDRKAARAKANEIKTRDDLEAYISMLNLSESEQMIARMLLIKKWPRAKIAMESGYSEHQVRRKIERIYDKMA